MDDDYEQDQDDNSNGPSYNDKIMVGSGAVLVSACIFIVLFHLFIRRNRRSHPRDHYPPVTNDNHRRRVSILNSILISPQQGLDISILNSIPTFTYELPKSYDGSPLVCAVCLSDFLNNEKGRVLPECKHCFHLDCISMWFQSHSDCPLCRAKVRIDGVEGTSCCKLDSTEGSVFVSVNEAAEDDCNDVETGHVVDELDYTRINQVPSSSSCSSDDRAIISIVESEVIIDGVAKY